MPLDPFSTPAREMVLPALIRLSAVHEPDLFYDGDRFMSHLNATFDSFDVMTYSVSKSRTFPLGRINRLIYGLKQRGTDVRCKQKKFVMNNHIKMFICYNENKLAHTPTIFLGSQNLTHGTNLNIMYKAQPCHVESLLTFFELVWNS